MKLNNASITFLVSNDSTEITIRDNDANCDFVRVKINPEQLSEMLSRIKNTPCEAEVFGLEKIGKKCEVDSFIFEIPKELRGSSHSEKLTILAVWELEKAEMSDWTPDSYFGSQNSFFSSRDDKEFARCTIRRWVGPTKTETP